MEGNILWAPTIPKKSLSTTSATHLNEYLDDSSILIDENFSIEEDIFEITFAIENMFTSTVDRHQSKSLFSENKNCRS